MGTSWTMYINYHPFIPVGLANLNVRDDLEADAAASW